MQPNSPASTRSITTMLATAALAMFVGGAPAQSETVFDGSKARVNLSNKLKMLTQKVASASCRIQAGIDANAARGELQSAQAEFNTILNGLENGGLALGIPREEKYRVVLTSIDTVREIWSPLDQASSVLVSGQGDANGAAVTIGAQNLDLLDAVDILASDIHNKYSNPNQLTQSDALALHFAGRQRMLGHRMAKEVCGIATASGDFGTSETLAQTIKLYDVSLQALKQGMPAAGINPPPTDAIRNELTAVDDVWQGNLPALTVFSENVRPSANNVVTVASLSSELMTDMSNVVTLYMLSTPGQDDVYRVPLQAYAEEELSKWLENPDLIAAVKQQNVEHRSLRQNDIDGLDQTWRAEANSAPGQLINDLLQRPVSEWMRGKQQETANFVTEVFAMDNLGLNVAQNVATSDFWQGDEAKWKETFGNGSGAIHISEVEFDESTGFYQSQVSMPIRDPATGELIGAITFGINVQSLL